MAKLKNKFEKKIHRQLKKLKVSFKYESERIPYIFAGHYIPDFVLSTPKGKIYIETKGYFRPEHKRKMVAVKKLNPQLDIRIVFYAKKLKDIKWAEKHGFIYAIDTVPERVVNMIDPDKYRCYTDEEISSLNFYWFVIGGCVATVGIIGGLIFWSQS